jgi:DNA-binding PadR family transcriptional regulator
MTRLCFLCGKKIGFLRSMTDQQYCSSEHRQEARLASAQAVRDEDELETWAIERSRNKKKTFGMPGSTAGQTASIFAFLTVAGLLVAAIYLPSPGTVYPTLTMLEDLGYARARPEESGKKIYEITDEGRAHLAENQPLIDDIFSRIADFAQNIFGEPMMEVHRGFKDVGKAIYASKSSTRTPEQIRKIKEILERTAAEIEAV